MMRRWIAGLTAVAVLAVGCSDTPVAPKMNSSLKGNEMPTGKAATGKAGTESVAN